MTIRSGNPRSNTWASSIPSEIRKQDGHLEKRQWEPDSSHCRGLNTAVHGAKGVMAQLMQRIAGLFLPALFLALAACAGTAPRSQVTLGDVGPDMVWQADLKKLQSGVAEHCDEEAPGGIDECFLKVMEILGARPAAIRFAAALDSAAHLHAFQYAGPIGVGWIHYPFRANERYGCLLLNGDPSPIDVDDPQFLPFWALKEDPRYRNIKRYHPEVSIWPGDRQGPGHIAVEELDEGGRRFVFGYEMRNGCRACEPLGSVEFAFDFDGEGNFLESGLFSVGGVIHTFSGRSVTVSLKTGYKESGRWQMIRLPPPDILRLESKVAEPGSGRRVRETETWRFLAGSPGRIFLQFRRVDPDSENVFPNARASFLVIIHEDEDILESALAGAFHSVIDRKLREIGSPRVGNVVLEIKGLHKDLARVDIRPRDPMGSEWAMAYLRHYKGEWVVVGMGQSFSPSFYKKNAIPLELQGPVDMGAEYVPLPLEHCNGLLNALSDSLGIRGELEESASFFDYALMSHGDACRVTLEGTGDVVKGLMEVTDRIRSLLVDMGYAEDPALAADGPIGAAAGFRKEEDLVLMRVLVEPAEGVGLLSIRPLPVSELAPEERLYTIVMEGARFTPTDP